MNAESDQDIRIKLLDIFEDVFGVRMAELRDELTLLDVPGFDSLKMINLMFAIEQGFQTQFAGNELAEFANVGELVAYLRDQAA